MARLNPLCALTVSAAIACSSVFASAVALADTPVTPLVADPESAAADAGRVTFAKRAAAMGDTLEQAIESSLDLRLRTRSGTQVLEERATASQRLQRRRVTATAIESGRVVAAEVRFFESRQSCDGRQADDPVVGKAYHCRRQGERLVVVTDEGADPPIDERILVEHAMESLGRSHPLADYLDGREVAIGEAIELPSAVAAEALGLDGRLGRVERFCLILREAPTVDGRKLAKFAAEVEASGVGSGQMRVVMDGAVEVEVDSCRVVAAELRGPMGMLQTRGSLGNQVLLDSTGRLSLRVAVEHRDARR
jgi:hypothetical protein